MTDPTMVDAPAKVKSELERLEIKTPDVGNSLSLKKGEKTKLTEEQFNRYRREVLEKSFAAIERTMALPKFKELDDKYKKIQINRAIAVQRKMVQEKIRNEMRIVK